MSPQPGDVSNLSHAEVVGTHIQPETQTSGFQEYPKHITLGEEVVVVKDELEEKAARLKHEIAEQDAALEALAKPETKLPEGETTGLQVETKHFSDGSSATGPGPLPDLSPEQQKAQTSGTDSGPQLVPAQPQSASEQPQTAPVQPQEQAQPEQNAQGDSTQQNTQQNS